MAQFILAPLASFADKYSKKKLQIFKVLILIQLMGYSCLLLIEPLQPEQGEKPASVVCGEKVTLMTSQAITSDPCWPATIRGKKPPFLACSLNSDSSMKANVWRESAQIIDKRLTVEIDERAFCDSNVTLTCESDLELSAIFNSGSKVSFWPSALLAKLCLIGGIANLGVVYFQDAICHQMILTVGSKESYGDQRLWASIGWGISAVLVGAAIDLSSVDHLLVNYTPGFAIFSLANALDLLVVNFIQLNNTESKVDKQVFSIVELGQVFGNTLKKSSSRALLIFCGIFGTSVGAYITLLFM